MKHLGKTWTTILFSAAALALGSCGREEHNAQSMPEIRTSAGSEGQEESTQAETVSLVEEDSTKLKEDAVLQDELAKSIKELEAYCRVKFPDNYISFIEEYNVGLPEAHTFWANHKEYEIERFLGFVNDYQNSPVGEYDIAVVMAPIETYMTDNPDLIGADLIPIAKLTTGDYVCLNFKDNQEEPSVCIWSSTESDEFQPVTYEVADSFWYFAESLE